MSKERLKSIKRKTVYLEGTDCLMMAIKTDDYRWLIKQAERVQVLENKLENVMDRHTYLEGDYYDLQKQNERYREALEEIARGRFPGASYKAQKALESEE